MTLSVIICTYNRDKYIYNVLESIALNKFDKKQYEIILINNNCTDNTEKECHRFCENYKEIEFRYFIEKNQGLSYARNRGIKEAKGDFLVYVDDDATVNVDYLQTYFDLFTKHQDIYAAGGPIIPEYETQKPKWMSFFVEQLLTGRLYLGEKLKEFPQSAFPGGGNAAYRTCVFEKVGLYNVELGRKGNSLIGAEEKDIFDKMNSLGMKIFYCPNAILYHIISEQKLTLTYLKRLSLSIGKSEKIRTLQISKSKYFKRIISEGIKWCATIILLLLHSLSFAPTKGWMLVIFRANVTKGLFS